MLLYNTKCLESCLTGRENMLQTEYYLNISLWDVVGHWCHDYVE